MNKLTLDTVASFTWMWGPEFFLETDVGNYIWSDPEYNGDNTIRPYAGSYQSYLREIGMGCGRDKGKHFIRDYCGDQVKIEEG